LDKTHEICEKGPKTPPQIRAVAPKSDATRTGYISLAGEVNAARHPEVVLHHYPLPVVGSTPPATRYRCLRVVLVHFTLDCAGSEAFFRPSMTVPVLAAYVWGVMF